MGGGGVPRDKLFTCGQSYARLFCRLTKRRCAPPRGQVQPNNRNIRLPLHIKLPQPINRFGYIAAHLMTYPILNFINLGVSEDIIRHINQGRGNAKGICKYDLTQIMRQSIGAKGTCDAQRGRNGFGKGRHTPSSFGV